MRYYFRRRGMQAVPLPGMPGSEEFMAAYSMALSMLPNSAEIGANRTSPGTINALVVDYYRSQGWKDLAPDTRKKRGRIIERFRAKHGDKRVALLRQEHIEKMLAAISKPSVKRDWFKAIRGLLRYAVPTMLKIDPTEGIADIKLPKSKGHHTWTDDEIEQYRAYLATRHATAARHGVRARDRFAQGRGRSPWSAACQEWPHTHRANSRQRRC